MLRRRKPGAAVRFGREGPGNPSGMARKKGVTPRPLWSGSISFGLVNVPVRLYPAVKEHKLHFHFVHEPDSSPIGYQKVCKAEGKPVDDDEVVKAFEYQKGKYVFLDDVDFEQAKAEGYRTIEITDFVPYEQIDPIFFAKTYYVGPNAGGEHVYALFMRALEDSELSAITKFVMRDRQHLGALRVRDGVLTLEQLYFADEIRPTDEIKVTKERVSKDELDMARRLIESDTSKWNPGKYKDTYQAELKKLIEAKRKGKDVHRAADVEEEEGPVDLLEALRASVEQHTRGKKRATRSSQAATDGDLDRLPKRELEKRARSAGIEGRSKMSKDDLVDALRAA
jgi:DNA end-binding protein Ku